MMRCVILICGLFEVGDDCKQNKIKLNQDINQLKEQQKAKAVKQSDLEKQLLEEKTMREKSKAMNQELKSRVNNSPRE